MKEEEYSGVDISNAKEEQGYKQAKAAEQAEKEQNVSKWKRFLNFFRNGRTRFFIGIVLLFAGIYLLVSFLSFFIDAGVSDQNRVANYSVFENAKSPGTIENAGAAVGALVSDFLIPGGVGIAAFIVVVWCFTLGMRLVRRGIKSHFFTYTLISLYSIFATSMIVGACTYQTTFLFFHLGGDFGYYANKWLLGLFGVYGMIAINILIAVLWVFLTYKMLKKLVAKLPKQLPSFRRSGDDDEQDQDAHSPSAWIGGPDSSQKEKPASDAAAGERKSSVPLPNPAISAPTAVVDPHMEPARRQRSPRKENKMQADAEATMMQTVEQATEISNPHDPTGEYVHYRFPTLDLLQNIKMKSDRVDITEQEDNKRRITETLNNYGIQIKHIEVQVGPTVTLFEIIPEDGVRISKIRNLEDDIALSLAALGIRIIAPMPGRGTIGIEVPNRDPQVVPMREVLSSKKFQEARAELPMCLGCTVSNDVFVADLVKMPHLLVAGATGKGKSVGLNAIITSLLYKKGPSELKFVLIDPKRVEFSVYADLEQYFFAKAPDEDRAIVTDTPKVVKTLNCLVQEMEDRYKVFEEVKVRKLEDYNRLWRSQLRKERDEDGNPKYRYMPYIVTIIDEFSDMIMTAGKEVEAPIVRIAQKARAVGIHMIIATQRPSAQVITGLIKTNFPGRIAFAVSQMVDSRIIIDRPGAQQLIGRGDMLFSIDGEITRLQCPFVDTPDIIRICDYIKEQEDKDKNIYHAEPYILPEYVPPVEEGVAAGDASAANLHDRDPLFEEAVRLVVQGDTASTSSLQRRYNIGYNRAGRIMDQMEAAGIVGPSQGGKPRKVLVDPMTVEQMLGNP